MSYSYSVCNCYECIKIDLSDQSKYDPNKYYCSEYRTYVNKNDRACSRYFVYNESLKRDQGCFITTAVVNILGFSDNCYELNKLRDFRENYMRKSIELIPLLVEYDIIGPKIKEELESDTFKHIKSLMIMDLYIRPICKMLDNKKYSDAIDKYIELTNNLKEAYNIGNIEYDINKIDIEECGKGHKIKIKEA